MNEITNTGDTENRALSLLKKVAGKMQLVVAFWVFICLTWSVVSTANAYLFEHAENNAAFTSSCIENGGKVRHDSWLFGVDVFCQESSGDESFFFNVSTVTYQDFVFTFVDRTTFTLFGIREMYSDPSINIDTELN